MLRTPPVPGRRTREEHLVPRLAQHHEVRVVFWHTRESASLAARLRFGATELLGQPAWQVPSLPRPPGWPPWRASWSQPLFRAALRHLERLWRPDVVVVGPSWYHIGFPPPLRQAVRVYDWVDSSGPTRPRWFRGDEEYLAWCDAVMAVSEPIARYAEPWSRPVKVIPNGFDPAPFQALAGRRDEIRRRLGVDGRHVVSLIGLTASEEPYWTEAVRRLAARGPRFLFAAVGIGPPLIRLRPLQAELGPALRLTGGVPYHAALEWFVASDVVWYPGDESDYFHGASPHKVLEGLAAGARVVVAPELRSLTPLRGQPGLHFAPCTAEALAAASEAARPSPAAGPPPGLDRWSWDNLAAEAALFLGGVGPAAR